jgi:hypothetical protein
MEAIGFGKIAINGTCRYWGTASWEFWVTPLAFTPHLLKKRCSKKECWSINAVLLEQSRCLLLDSFNTAICAVNFVFRRSGFCFHKSSCHVELVILCNSQINIFLKWFQLPHPRDSCMNSAVYSENLWFYITIEYWVLIFILFHSCTCQFITTKFYNLPYYTL